MHCAACGQPVDPGKKFCTQCGTPLPAAAARPPEPSPPEPFPAHPDPEPPPWGASLTETREPLTPRHMAAYLVIFLVLVGGLRYARAGVTIFTGAPVSGAAATSTGVTLTFPDGWIQVPDSLLTTIPQFKGADAAFYRASNDSQRPYAVLFVWRSELPEPLPANVTQEALLEILKDRMKEAGAILGRNGLMFQPIESIPDSVGPDAGFYIRGVSGPGKPVDIHIHISQQSVLSVLCTIGREFAEGLSEECTAVALSAQF